MTLSKKKLTLRHKIYMFIIIAGLINIFSPYIIHADLFGFEVQDVYTQITSNVKETNDILKKAFEFAQISPYDVVNSISGTAQGNIAVSIRNASKSMALVVAALLLMVDFFRKSINFEWSSKWENVLIFLIKIIVIKQVVQNTDVIIGHIYSGFQYINNVANGTSPDFLPYGTAEVFTWTDEDGIMTKMVKKGWWNYWYDWGAGEYRDTFSYLISEESVKIFYPDAKFGGTNLNLNPLSEPTTMLFMPTLEIVLLQPYFLVMKAIAYIVFVIAIGRVFELSIYTILAPLPLVTFASDTTHDVAKNFIKNYIAAVLQIAVIVVMFVVYAAVNHYFASYDFAKAVRLIQLVELIALGLGVVKSGAWSKKVCGIG
ncbi:MAG TPA: hypothetical protein DIW26_01425 [Ruminococcus sp.]|nr:hypothetical protein [Ruminococcus sp.]